MHSVGLCSNNTLTIWSVCIILAFRWYTRCTSKRHTIINNEYCKHISFLTRSSSNETESVEKHHTTVQWSTIHFINLSNFLQPMYKCAQFTHVGLKLRHGGTVVCWTANSTVHVCSTQMDHTECPPCIQPPNTRYRPRFSQGDHHGNTNQNLHLAAVYYNGPDRNQCTGEKFKCLSWDCDWTVQYSIFSQVTMLDCSTNLFASGCMLYCKSNVMYFSLQ